MAYFVEFPIFFLWSKTNSKSFISSFYISIVWILSKISGKIGFRSGSGFGKFRTMAATRHIVAIDFRELVKIGFHMKIHLNNVKMLFANIVREKLIGAPMAWLAMHSFKLPISPISLRSLSVEFPFCSFLHCVGRAVFAAEPLHTAKMPVSRIENNVIRYSLSFNIIGIISLDTYPRYDAESGARTPPHSSCRNAVFIAAKGRQYSCVTDIHSIIISSISIVRCISVRCIL